MIKLETAYLNTFVLLCNSVNRNFQFDKILKNEEDFNNLFHLFLELDNLNKKQQNALDRLCLIGRKYKFKINEDTIKILKEYIKEDNNFYIQQINLKYIFRSAKIDPDIFLENYEKLKEFYTELKINCSELKESDIQLIRSINGDDKKTNKLSHEEQFKRRVRCLKKFEDYTDEEIINNTRCFVYEKDLVLNSERIDYLYTRGIAEKFILKDNYLLSEKDDNKLEVHPGTALNRLEIFLSYNGKYKFKDIFPKVNEFLVGYLHDIDNFTYSDYERRPTKEEFILRFCNPRYKFTREYLITIAGLLSLDFYKEDYKFIFKVIGDAFKNMNKLEWLKDVNFDDPNILDKIKELSTKLRNMGIQIINGEGLDNTEISNLKSIFTFE